MSLKILVMILYKNRPRLLRRTVESVIHTGERHQNWHLALHDDINSSPGEKLVRELLPKKMMSRVTFYRTQPHSPTKISLSGSLGFVINQMIKNSDADIGMILEERDALFPQYFQQLNKFFTEHPQEAGCYCHVVTHDIDEQGFQRNTNTDTPLNKYKARINACNKLDISQVSWRLRVNRQGDVCFPYPSESGYKNSFLQLLGVIPYLGVFGQYKLKDSADNDIRRILHAASNCFNDRDFHQAYPLLVEVLKDDPTNQEALSMYETLEALLRL